MTNVTAAAIPSHVPAHLVRDIDVYNIAVGEDPQRDFAETFRNEPELFYIPRTVKDPQWGNWVVTRRADIQRIMQDTEHFTTRGISGFDRAFGGEEWLAYPLEADPPLHGHFRTLLNPLFSPLRIKALEAAMRSYTIGVIEEARPLGQADFAEIARKLPAGLFSHFLGLTVEETLQVMAHVRLILHSGYDPEARKRGIEWLMGFERELLERRAREGGDDLITLMLQARIDDRPLTEKEMFGLFFFFLLAGLDTVSSATVLHFRHLALDAALRRQLVAKPELIPATIEELLRRYSQIVTNRFVAKDIEMYGVTLRKGDNVILAMPLANLDPTAIADPLAIDVGRPTNPHIAFGSGPHRCIGSNIARQQLRITYEEWLRRVPEFRLVPGAKIHAICSEAIVLANLPMSWDVQGAA
jgi:cytochrome P450